MTISHPHRSLLVVDDDRDTADSLALLFEVHGFDVRAAYTAGEAVASMAARPAAAVVADIKLGGEDGCDLADVLLGGPWPRPFLVAVTGMAGQSERCQEAGFDCVFTKPVSPTLLMAVLDARLPQRRGTA